MNLKKKSPNYKKREHLVLLNLTIWTKALVLKIPLILILGISLFISFNLFKNW